MAVTANQGCAGKGESLLWSNNVDNALPLVAEAKVGDSEFLDILLKSYTLCAGVVLLDEAADVLQ